MPPCTLLVIGIHREELAFGEAVAEGLHRGRIDVLRIADGLSGRRPRPDQRFVFEKLHRALYLQLLPHLRVEHGLLVDLHTGLDARGPCADIYTRDIPGVTALLAGLAKPHPAPRLVPLLQKSDDGPSAATVIPPEVWRSPRFLYVGLEVYLPEAGRGRPVDHAYARVLIEALASGEG